jgi:hypothetical protein
MKIKITIYFKKSKCEVCTETQYIGSKFDSTTTAFLDNFFRYLQGEAKYLELAVFGRSQLTIFTSYNCADYRKRCIA